MSKETPLPSRTATHSAKAKTKSKQKPQPSKKRFRWGRAIFIFLGLVILSLGIYVAYLYNVGKENLGKIAEQDPIRAVVPVEERAQVKPLAVALLGLDYRKKLGNMNTDVMMVAAFNPKTKTATVVTIPRDSDLNVDGYKRHKANGYYAAFYSEAKKDKKEGEALAAYARDETKLLLERFFDVKINYTAVIDFQGFIDVVDALGGVYVNVDQDMRWVDTVDGTDINLKKGEQQLDGGQALDFVRYRKSNRGTAPSSDFERNERQSQVLGAITDKLKSFGSITKIDNILNAVGNNLRTDIPEAQIENMITTYFGISRSAIRFIPLEGTWKSPYVYLNEASVETAKKALAEELSQEGRASAESPGASPSGAKE